jgi:hypothetical protein
MLARRHSRPPECCTAPHGRTDGHHTPPAAHRQGTTTRRGHDESAGARRHTLGSTDSGDVTQHRPLTCCAVYWCQLRPFRVPQARAAPVRARLGPPQHHSPGQRRACSCAMQRAGQFQPRPAQTHRPSETRPLGPDQTARPGLLQLLLTGLPCRPNFGDRSVRRARFGPGVKTLTRQASWRAQSLHRRQVARVGARGQPAIAEHQSAQANGRSLTCVLPPHPRNGHSEARHRCNRCTVSAISPHTASVPGLPRKRTHVPGPCRPCSSRARAMELSGSGLAAGSGRPRTGAVQTWISATVHRRPKRISAVCSPPISCRKNFQGQCTIRRGWPGKKCQSFAE